MLVGKILAHADRRPSKPALIYNEAPLTYRELSRAVYGAMGELSDAKVVGPGITVVAIQDLCKAWITCLALRRLGRATLVLSSSDLLQSLSLSGLREVVCLKAETWPDLADICAARNLPCVGVALDRQSDGEPPAGAHGEGGHILQTSGTTGVPKHVLYDPSFEPRYFDHYRAITNLSDSSVFGAFHFPLWTAAGYRSPFATLLAGGTVVAQLGRPPHRVLRPALTSATVTPALLRAILDAPRDAFAPSSTLRLVISSGTASRAEIEQARMRISPLIEIRIGTTEAQIVASTFVDAAVDVVWHRPAPGVHVDIVDEAGRPVTPDHVGHLRVAIADSPTGYLDDPVTTAAFFRGGFFHPGDLAVSREDGCFTLQGRVTDIINVNGYKRAPAPVEDLLSREFGVRGMCLLSLVTDDNSEDLFVVIESDGSLDNDALGAALRRELGAFPNAHTFATPQLPRNGMGKLMRDIVKAQLIAVHPALQKQRSRTT